MKGKREARWTGKIKIVHHVLDAPLRWTKPAMVFVNSMSDVFHENIREYDILKVFDVMNQAEKHTFQILTKRPERLLEMDHEIKWTPNIWMGVSIESKDTLHRIRTLSESAAKIKFISAEPLLEDVCPEFSEYVDYLDWVIVGGESGPNARKMDREWAISIHDICNMHDVAYFFKQMGGTDFAKGGSVLRLDDDSLVENEYPIYQSDVDKQIDMFG